MLVPGATRASRAAARRHASALTTRGVQCSQQHLGIVGDKSLARIKHLGLCRNKLSALPPKISIMISLVEIRCTDNWLKFLPQVRRHSVAGHMPAVVHPWLCGWCLTCALCISTVG